MAEAQSAQSESNLPIQPVYDAASLAGFDPDEKLGAPGQYPFTRGLHATGYRTVLLGEGSR